jgi:phosphoserine phosphatase RsbU/P
VSAGDELPAESAEDLYENAPCGYLTTRLDGTIVRVNSTFERWTGLRREDLLGATRLQDLLSPGDRIYHETHYSPLLQMQGSIREIAVEIVRADGSKLPALLNSVLRADPAGAGRLVRTMVFDASDRRRYERELLEARRDQHEVAERLQRGLLSRSLPEVAGVELEVAYRPAKAGTRVGGDWYDAFPVGKGEEIMLVVGDVVGRGIGAAAEMGQLRSAIRAFAATGLGPAALLEALDRYSARFEVGELASVVCAQLEPSSGRLLYCCAGHLPPLICEPDGEAGFAWEGRSRPLATPFSPSPPREEAAVTLAPGSLLVLYTDGLVERRDRGVDPGMAALLEAVRHHRQEPVAVLAGELIRAMHDPGVQDDVCLLVARRA